MVGSRTAILVRIYLTLVGVSLMLIAIQVYRHFPAIFAPVNPVNRSVVTTPRDAASASGPSVNWGGQRR